MFEDSLVESEGRLASRSRRWITVGSVGLQCLVAAVIVIVPMVRPEALAFRMIAPAVAMPVMKRPVIVVQKTLESRAASSATPMILQVATRSAVLPSLRARETEMAGVVGPVGTMTGTGVGVGFLGAITEPAVVAAPVRKTGPVKVSAGVSSGMLLGEIRPVYPRIAVAARVEGTVVVEATISKTGAIESARVVSGPGMLAGAALDAVRAARYRPYRLNGEATEVQTTVTVNFRLGS